MRRVWAVLVVSALALAGAGSVSGRAAGGFEVAAAGDLCGSQCDETADLVAGKNPDLVLTLGDHAYPSGTTQQFLQQYAPTWGKFLTKTEAAPGNHDWKTSNALGFRSFFGFGSGPLYRSFDDNGWHFVAMDTTKMDSTQENWIERDLQQNSLECIVAYGHHPRFSSGIEHGGSDKQADAWRELSQGGADIVLYGHEHNYERFDPIDGMREFVVGTGGAPHYRLGSPKPKSRVRIDDEWGALFLTLGSGSYTWRFEDVGGHVLDSGSGTC